MRFDVCSSRRGRGSTPRMLRAPRLAAALALLVPAMVGAACVVADPASDLVAARVFRPTIVRGSVVPPVSGVLTRFPSEFVVPVEVLSPGDDFEWKVFVDFDSVHSAAFPVLGETSAGDPSDPNMTVRAIAFTLAAPQSGDPALLHCHVVEFIVARRFQPDSPHTPDGIGGDSVSWLYDPTGTLADCPVYGNVTFAEGGDGDADAADVSAVRSLGSGASRW